MDSNDLMPALADENAVPNAGQRTFLRYYTGAFMDLVVLGLCAQYWDMVHVSSFSVALMAAVVLQLLLRWTIALEHKIGHFWKSRGPGGMNTFMRYFCAWLVLFGSKFAILEALASLFGHDVHFEGRWHGIITLIVVVVIMLVAEEVMLRIYRRIT
jgi:uncharacterized membrane protein YvlD (DUF360 family)